MTAERLRRHRRQRRGAAGRLRAVARRRWLLLDLVALGSGRCRKRIVPSWLATTSLARAGCAERGACATWTSGLRAIEGPALVRPFGLAPGTLVVGLDAALLRRHPRVARASACAFPGPAAAAVGARPDRAARATRGIDAKRALRSRRETRAYPAGGDSARPPLLAAREAGWRSQRL
jgi:hypothetical protein